MQCVSESDRTFNSMSNSEIVFRGGIYVCFGLLLEEVKILGKGYLQILSTKSTKAYNLGIWNSIQRLQTRIQFKCYSNISCWIKFQKSGLCILVERIRRESFPKILEAAFSLYWWKSYFCIPLSTLSLELTIVTFRSLLSVSICPFC